MGTWGEWDRDKDWDIVDTIGDCVLLWGLSNGGIIRHFRKMQADTQAARGRAGLALTRYRMSFFRPGTVYESIIHSSASQSRQCGFFILG
jgi:hypothetical protein